MRKFAGAFRNTGSLRTRLRRMRRTKVEDSALRHADVAALVEEGRYGEEGFFDCAARRAVRARRESVEPLRSE